VAFFVTKADAKYRDINDVQDECWWANGDTKLYWHILENKCVLFEQYIEESIALVTKKATIKWNINV